MNLIHNYTFEDLQEILLENGFKNIAHLKYGIGYMIKKLTHLS